MEICLDIFYYVETIKIIFFYSMLKIDLIQFKNDQKHFISLKDTKIKYVIDMMGYHAALFCHVQKYLMN